MPRGSKLSFQITASGQTDVGLARKHNEDYFEIDPDRNLYVVADGMGGHSHGEVASRIAVEAIRDYIVEEDGSDATGISDEPQLREHSNRLRNAVRTAHDQVLDAIHENGALQGMGTTVVGFLVDSGVAAVAHVGDSRAYRLRDGRLELLTQDHTWVHEQVLAGYLSEEQARVHPLKNVVTRALGSEKEITVDLQEQEVRGGDLYLICSDGLTTMLNDEEIAERLDAARPLEVICRGLIDEANARGGLDNITVILLRVDDP